MDNDTLFKDIQLMADQGADPEEIRGYIASVGKNPDDYISATENPEKTGFIQGLLDLSGTKKTGDPASATKPSRVDALLKGLGRVSPTVEGAYSNPKGALSAIVETAPIAATGGQSIPAQMAVQGASTGLSGIARELLGGNSLKGALKEGGEEGFLSSAITGGLGAAGKIAKPIVKGVGRGLAAISPIPEEKIYEAVARPKEIFKKGWTNAQPKIDELSDILSSKVSEIKSATNKEVSDIAASNLALKEKNKLITEQTKKSNIDLSNQAGILANNAMKEIESNSGSLVGSARKSLKETAKESSLYGDDMAKEVDSIIEEGTIIDPSGEISYASPTEMSFLKDIKKELLGRIDRGEAKSSVLDPIFGPMITTKDTMGRAPISPARISTIIGKIDDFVTYGPKYSSDVVTTEGEYLLKKARNSLNEKLRALSPEIAQANDNSFLVKEIKSSLQSRTDKSIAGLIKDYHKGNIFPRQKEALENLQAVSGVNFLEQSMPINPSLIQPQSVPQDILSKQDLLEGLYKLSTQRGARSMMQSFSKVTPEETQKIQSLLGDEGDSILSQLKDLDIAKEFVRKRPSLYGALGSAGPALALGNTSKPLAIAATLGAVSATSPRMNSYVVRSLPYTKAGAKILASGLKASSPLAARAADGSMTTSIYEEYQKSRGGK